MPRQPLLGLIAAGLLLTVPAWADTKGVRVDGKAPADYIAAQAGKSWAVVIGIDDYEHAPRLHYAVADATAMARLLAQRGYQVAALYNRQATKDAIEEELGDKLLDRVGEHDRVVIFYSGHGETKTVKGGKTQGFLLPVGGSQEALAKTGISMGRIRELADALPSKHVLFLMDVCYGGIAGTQFKSLPKYTEAYLKAITRERGRQLITAGGPEQQALEGPEWGHSVFTYYLLEGLDKGHADLNSDGIIPASELFAYLDSRVFAAAQMKGHTQKPELWSLAAEKGEFVFFTSARGTGGGGMASGMGTDALAAEREQLEAERQRIEAEKLAVQSRRDAERQRVEAEQKRLEVARAMPYEAPRQMGREITGKDGAPMVLVPAGEFIMGSNDGDANEKPERRVTLEAFYIDKYEVSTRLYAAFIRDTRRAQPYDWSQQVALVGRGDRPVVNVTWYDADAYCRHYGKRLPMEQEWEKAARGTDGRKYPWGNEEPTRRHTLFSTEWHGYGTLATVESYEAGKSPYGLYHMAGNVWEWTSSDYDNSGEFKVVRGGSWLANAWLVRSATRLWYYPSDRPNRLGFRCAQDAR